MPGHYDSKSEKKVSDKKPPMAKASKSKKLTDKQKSDLKKHMDKLDLSASEKKSHRMKMISRMSKGMSVGKAHKDIMK